MHTRKAVFFAIFFFALVASTVYGQSASTMANDQVNASYLQRVKPYSLATGSNVDGGGVLGKHSSGAVLGVDSVANWSSYFYAPRFDSFEGTQFDDWHTMLEPPE